MSPNVARAPPQRTHSHRFDITSPPPSARIRRAATSRLGQGLASAMSSNFMLHCRPRSRQSLSHRSSATQCTKAPQTVLWRSSHCAKGTFGARKRVHCSSKLYRACSLNSPWPAQCQALNCYPHMLGNLGSSVRVLWVLGPAQAKVFRRAACHATWHST